MPAIRAPGRHPSQRKAGDGGRELADLADELALRHRMAAQLERVQPDPVARGFVVEGEVAASVSDLVQALRESEPAGGAGRR